MDKVAYFKITRLKISRFKSHVEETEYHFGDLTMISGGNHTGKTTIADAIAWVMIGQGFFGGHPVSYTHLDVYKRQVKTYAQPKMLLIGSASFLQKIFHKQIL